MVVHIEITDSQGRREQTLDQDAFWIGAEASGCPVEVEIAACRGRLLEVQPGEGGGLCVRAEAGLPFPVRSATGNVGTRFETLLDGDILNLGPALLKLRRVPVDAERGQEIDPSTLSEVDAAGSPVGSWYQTFMEVADSLEAVKTPQKMIRAAMEAILATTGADRVCLLLDREVGIEARSSFHLSGSGSGRGDDRPFRISRSLVTQVRDSGRVVHVPIASADPVASRYKSVRREGISASITMPIRALGKTFGILHADCVRTGAVLTPTDLQRVAFIGRLLAGSLGNRDLVASLVRTDPARDVAEHLAIRTSSPACAEMVERIKLYAPTDYTVLIRGETGTGKEVVAHAIHDLSPRAKGPFVPVNCAAIPEQLMESTLFGHEKGAFTGATQGSRGQFEEAHGGTILLDEIGDMAMDLQAKILRVLQDRVVTPVGSRRRVKVDVRILAATHQDLEKMVGERRFRADLYYRLRELEIGLPALRDRPEDILMLCERFLGEAARELRYAEPPEILVETLAELQRQPWRGNIRELRHVIKGAALRAGGGPIRVEHLDSSPVLGQGSASAASAPIAAGRWKERLEAQERGALRETLDRSGGNLTRGAQLFGVPRTTYREKLVKHGLLSGKERSQDGTA